MSDQSGLGAAGMSQSDDAKLLQLLGAAKTKRNKVPISEFKHYLPLFQKSETGSHQEITEESSDEEVAAHEQYIAERRELSEEWASRVSLRHEVQIVADEDPSVVIETLPPICTEMTDLSEADPRSGELLDALMNNIGRDNGGLRDHVTPVAQAVSQAIKKSRDHDQIAKTKETFDKHVNRIEGSGEETGQEEEPDAKEAMSGAKWD